MKNKNEEIFKLDIINKIKKFLMYINTYVSRSRNASWYCFGNGTGHS